ncbi:MAG TPA: hypothetical protein ENI94_08315 [Gammaproteobacteria bacterium]|nr:hypothetical protein [Gammaproteobacteria bacterium]
MWKINKTTILIALSTLGLMSCSAQQIGADMQEGQHTTSAIGQVVNLDQGWTVDTQQSFYTTTQGSRILPYRWYLNLEQKNSQTLFRDNDHIARLKYLPSKKNRWNPDGLAVGFTKDIDKESQQAWMGFNCSTCHTTQIRYKDIEMRIDGGPTMGDFETFNRELVSAMSETYKNSQKFDRFASRVLDPGYTPNQKAKLRDALLQQTEVLAKRNQINHPTPDQPRYGYGRVDAIGAIFNQILAEFSGAPNNGRASDAPVSYPFLWGTHQSNVVQWPGFAPNGPLSVGALIRNGGEVLGVYGQLYIPDNPAIKRYKSSLAVKNLGQLEQWVAELRSPQWPAQYLPAIDPILAAKGEIHYQQYCSNCHQVIKREDEGKPYNAVLTPLAEVKTDPQELQNMLATRPAGKFEGRKELVIAGDVIPAETSGLDPLVNAVVGALLDQPINAIIAAVKEFEGGAAAATANDGQSEKYESRLVELLQKYGAMRKELKLADQSETQSIEDNPLAVYKARPLNGIWATAPYLHNGSVPNLYEILLPQAQRSVTFHLGSREFDPSKVGFISTPDLAEGKAFKFDTRLVGNSNEGHEYGTELSKAEKLELLEYMKSL